MLRKLKLGCAAAVSLLGIAAGAAPAAACGYYGCGGEAVVVQPQPYVVVQPQPYVVVQPQPYVAQSCSCCGCGTQAYSYGAYAPAYAAPNYYYRPDYSGYVAAQWGPRLGGYGYRRSWMR
jgi:hypothetical protein